MTVAEMGRRMMEIPGPDTSSEERDLTVVAALASGDEILVASDSDATWLHSLPVRQQFWKLHWRTDVPLAWGTAGAADVGEEFNRWLMTLAWRDDATWDAFRRQASDRLATANGDKRRRVKRSGSKPDDSDAGQVLIAGFIGDEMNVLELDGRGSADFCGRRFAAIGSGGPYARIVFRTTQLLPPARGLSTTDLLRSVVDVTTQVAPGCRPPIHVLRVARAGVTDLTPD